MMSSDEIARKLEENHETDNITDYETIISTEKCDSFDVDRLLNLILKLECDKDEEFMWFKFLGSVKKELTNKPKNVIKVLKNWLQENKRDDQDDDNFNDFLLEYYCSCIRRKKQRICLNNDE